MQNVKLSSRCANVQAHLNDEGELVLNLGKLAAPIGPSSTNVSMMLAKAQTRVRCDGHEDDGIYLNLQCYRPPTEAEMETFPLMRKAREAAAAKRTSRS